jgi:hypothetical protein
LFANAARRAGWDHVFTPPTSSAAPARPSPWPPVFARASAAAPRGRRSGAVLPIPGLAAASATFALDTRAGPQFQRAGFDHPNECSNGQSFCCTW